MIGIVYLKSNNRVIAIVKDVQSVTNTECIGLSGSARGVNTSMAGIAVVTSTSLTEGDTLGEYTDVRDQLPLSDKAKIAELESQVATLLSQNGGG